MGESEGEWPELANETAVESTIEWNIKSKGEVYLEKMQKKMRKLGKGIQSDFYVSTFYEDGCDGENDYSTLMQVEPYVPAEEQEAIQLLELNVSDQQGEVRFAKTGGCLEFVKSFIQQLFFKQSESNTNV